MAPVINVADLLAYGEQQIGKPYVFGAAGPNTFDCSGLISYMYKKFGVTLPHHSEDQASYGTPIAKGSIAAGDLVFSDWGDGPNSHVGIATGSDSILVAPHTGTNVQIQKLTPSYLGHVTAVRRVNLPDQGSPATAQQPAAGAPPAGGGSSNPLESLWQGALSAGENAINTFTSPFKEIAKPLQDIGSAAIEVATIGDKIMKLFLPSNFMRLVAGFGGVTMILIGVFFLSRELRTE